MTTDQVIKTITVGTSPRGITTWGNNIVVANNSSGSLTIIDGATDTVAVSVLHAMGSSKAIKLDRFTVRRVSG